MSPQTENGFTKIANELLDAICRLHISGNECSYLHALIRKTYGYNKKEDWITNSQIAQLTGMNPVRVSEAKKKLIALQIVTENRNKISLQKDYSKWGQLRKTVIGVTENRKKSYGKPYTQKTKDNIKENSKANALAGNKTDMSFQKRSDDYEEGVIDLDSSLTLVELKKPAAKKYPHAPAVRKLFQEVMGRNPANWKINKTQLQACENLYTERTLEKTRLALEWYMENKDKEYCPQISSPYDLDSKWVKLGEFKIKNI